MHDPTDVAERGGEVEGKGRPWHQMKPRVWKNLDELYAGKLFV
jgi:hypothetical protein